LKKWSHEFRISYDFGSNVLEKNRHWFKPMAFFKKTSGLSQTSLVVFVLVDLPGADSEPNPASFLSRYRFESGGGRVKVRRVDSLSDPALLSFDALFNCTGFGAKGLTGDSKLVPVRGQVLKVRQSHSPFIS
jgi:hypothetical protein